MLTLSGYVLVYSANPSVHNDDKGYRLENFFWRIWGSKHLLRSMTGSMLADLFSRIPDQRSISLSELHKVWSLTLPVQIFLWV